MKLVVSSQTNYEMLNKKEDTTMNKKTAIITGASRGIGKAIAIYFAKNGYNVIINCKKNIEALQKVKEEISQYKVTCISHIGDLSKPEIVEELFAIIDRNFLSLDVLVNNAGISYVGLLTDMTPDDWNQILSTNLSSVFYCCSKAIPLMLPAKAGKIINISSVWGSVGASCEVAYSTTKGGMNAFTKALAKELAPSNIQVNAIACGAIETEMNSFLSSEDKEALVLEIPANRFGKTEEVAHLAYQLATSSSYLTGQVIHLDGGWI